MLLLYKVKVMVYVHYVGTVVKRTFLLKTFLFLVTVIIFGSHELKSAQQKNQQEPYQVRWMYASPQLQIPLEFIFTDPQLDPGCDRISLRTFTFNNLKQRWLGSKKEQRPVQVICVDPRPVSELSVPFIDKVANWVKEHIGNRFVKHLEYRDRHERLERSVSPESFKEDMKKGLVGALHFNDEIKGVVDREIAQARAIKACEAKDPAASSFNDNKKGFFSWKNNQKMAVSDDEWLEKEVVSEEPATKRMPSKKPLFSKPVEKLKSKLGPQQQRQETSTQTDSSLGLTEQVIAPAVTVAAVLQVADKECPVRPNVPASASLEPVLSTGKFTFVPRCFEDEKALSATMEKSAFFKGLGHGVEKGKQYVSAGFEKIKNALEKFKKTHPISAVDQNAEKKKSDEQVAADQSVFGAPPASTLSSAPPSETKKNDVSPAPIPLEESVSSSPVTTSSDSGNTLTSFEESLGIRADKEKTFFSHISENPVTAVAVTVGSVVAVYGMYKLFVYLHAQKAERIALRKRLRKSLEDRSCVVL